MQKHCESKDWDWDKEVQSQILHQLSIISCQLANMTKKKGTKTIKPGNQFEPEYVTEAKKSYAKKEQQRKKLSEDELEEVKDFWQRRNYNVKNVEKINEKSKNVAK